ncbi:hypothetical protein F7725_027018 [Dissostichus mawsoni]|uniref:CxC3 like cysteine cluster domain-containing protein n=1 Tax=Dissostichus mawsoni TaxID=36200 RepID=A0A7J5X965_DISMA|nr:hypothetical protein F7725_027018 [Dissostichus mawsoni]
MASLDWGTRKSLFLERWKTERPRLINSTAAQENVANRICQQCGSNPAAVRCHDCRPRPFLCAECDVSMHTTHVLHNRDAMTAGFFQPLLPTTFIADKALSHCVRLMPVEMPEKICGCHSVLKGQPRKGRHNLSMPELSCHTCDATWAAGLDDLIQSGYWPATLHFSTIYETDVFYSFEEMKISCQAFLRMLDQRTFRFGRSGKISADSFQKSFFEWEAVRFEVENICKEESFICKERASSVLRAPRICLRFQWMETILTKTYVAFRSEEKATFEGVFIAKDEEVTRFVDYTTTKHGVCGGEWSAARETSQRSTSKVEEEGLELADGAGLTLGEEVEQCNAFLSRIAVTTKHTSKAGRTDMLTLLAMRWNQQKFKNVATSLCHRYQKTTKALQNQLQNLETMKVQMAVTESKLEDWVNDVKEWAEAAKTTTTSNDADALASRTEVLVASIKRRSQRLYKGTDCSKGRARIRRKIRTEKGILTSVVESYNRMVVSTETILSGETKTERPRDKESESSHRSSILLSSASSLV